MKNKKVIIHAGMHKTGTSSIQDTLFNLNNKEALFSRKCTYIRELLENNGFMIYNLFTETNAMNYVNNTLHGYNAETVVEINEATTKYLKEWAHKNDEGILILSGEDMALMNKGELEKMRKFIRNEMGVSDIEVILYVRSPVSYFVSLIQTLEIQGTIENDFIIDNYLQFGFYKKTIKNMWEAFGKENVNLYKFEEILKQYKGPVEHFLHVLGFNQKEIENFEIAKKNESHCQEVVDFVSFFNKEIPRIIQIQEREELNGERRKFDYFPILDVKGIRFDMPLKEKQQIARQSWEDVEWLKKNTDIDYLNELEELLEKNTEEDRISQPETYKELCRKFTRLNKASKKLFMEYLEQKKELNFYMNDLYYDCGTFYNMPQILTEYEPNLTNGGQHTLQIFYDTGEGFNEKEIISYPFENELVFITHTFSGEKDIKSVRIDPDFWPVFVYIKSIKINGIEEKNRIIGGNWHFKNDDTYLFLTVDPQIIIETEKPIEKIEIEMLIDPINETFKYFSLQNFINAIANKNGE